MPTLYEYKDYSGFYILTRIRNNFVTYQLTLEGRKKLRSLGVKPGEVFSRNILLGLFAFGDVYTHRGPGQSRGEQLVIPFPPNVDSLDEKDNEVELPLCADCSSPDDLHFVELLGEKRRATLLCYACREKRLSSIDTSIPLPFVTRGLLDRIFAMRDISEKDRSVENYQKILDMEFEKKWDKLAENTPPPPGRLFDDPPEGELF